MAEESLRHKILGVCYGYLDSVILVLEDKKGRKEGNKWQIIYKDNIPTMVDEIISELTLAGIKKRP